MFNEAFSKENKVEPDPEPMLEQFPDEEYDLNGVRAADPFKDDEEPIVKSAAKTANKFFTDQDTSFEMPPKAGQMAATALAGGVAKSNLWL